MKTKIKYSDKIEGLYVNAGGYVAIPTPNGTSFKEGNEVKTHHFGGSTRAGVARNEKGLSFKNFNDYETWMTIGITASDLKNKSKIEVQENLDFYQNDPITKIRKLCYNNKWI